MSKELAPVDARIPPWNLDDLSDRQCPICGSQKHEPKYLRPDKLTVRLCGECLTYFVSPSPSEGQLKLFYSRYDEIYRRDPIVAGSCLAETLLRADPLADIRIQEICSMTELKGKRCLDVGFGRGAFLCYFKSLGALPFGVDLDQKAVLFAKQNLAVQSVVEGTIDSLGGDVTFDVITMNDLIEHPLQPALLFEKSVRLLNPGGLIAMYTPNGSFIEEEDQPIALRVDLEHMQYLSLSSCLVLARRCGLDIVHLESLGFPFLEGIDRLPEREPPKRTPKQVLKSAVKGLPGFRIAKRICRWPAKESVPARSGRYHLFCIFKNSTRAGRG